MTKAIGLRVGVVGCGYWGSKHIRVLHALESVDSIAAIDPNPDRALQLARHYPGIESYQDLDAALPYLDAVIIATPPSTHKPALRS